MNPDNWKRVKANYKYFVENLDCSEVTDYLLQSGTLTSPEYERVREDQSGFKKAKTLLSILVDKNQKGYDNFITCLLQSKQKYLVDKLNSTDITTFDESNYNSFLATDERLLILLQQLLPQTEQLLKVQQDQLDSGSGKQGYEKLIKVMEKNNLNQDHVMSILGAYLQTGDVPNLRNDASTPSSPNDPVETEKTKFSFEPDEEHQNFSEALARELGRDIVRYTVQKYLQKHISRPSNMYAATMRRLVDELTDSHKELFSKFIIKLNIDEMNGYQTFINVADEIFAEGLNNWGRIIVLYAFVGWMATYCAENSMEKMVDVLGDFLGFYIARKMGNWIEENGGWDSFQKKFAEGDVGAACSPWKTVLLAAVGIAGAGALIGIVAARNT